MIRECSQRHRNPWNMEVVRVNLKRLQFIWNVKKIKNYENEVNKKII